MRTGWEVLLAGKILAGCFGGTFSTVLAYLAELSMPNMDLLKQRQTWVFSVRTVIPIAIGSIGGAIATFGLFIPFLVSSVFAFAGFFFVFFALREATRSRPSRAAAAQATTANSRRRRGIRGVQVRHHGQQRRHQH